MRKFGLLIVTSIGVQVLMVSSIAENDLPFIVLTGFEDNHHRVNEVIRVAHTLAEIGAGYEAARVLAAIALRAHDSDPELKRFNFSMNGDLQSVWCAKVAPKTLLQRLQMQCGTAGIPILHCNMFGT